MSAPYHLLCQLRMSDGEGGGGSRKQVTLEVRERKRMIGIEEVLVVGLVEMSEMEEVKECECVDCISQLQLSAELDAFQVRRHSSARPPSPLRSPRSEEAASLQHREPDKALIQCAHLSDFILAVYALPSMRDVTKEMKELKGASVAEIDVMYSDDSSVEVHLTSEAGGKSIGYSVPIIAFYTPCQRRVGMKVLLPVLKDVLMTGNNEEKQDKGKAELEEKY